MLPSSLIFKNTVDWVPVDIVSQINVEFLFKPCNSSEPTQSDGSTGYGNHNPYIPIVIDKPEPGAIGRPDTSSQPHDLRPAPQDIEHAECSLDGPEAILVVFDRGRDSVNDPSAITSEGRIPDGKPDHSAIHSTRIFHIANPHPRPWHEILPMLQDACSTPLHPRSFAEWLTALQQQPEREGTIEELQRIGLFEFFNDTRLPVEEPVLDTAIAVRSSATLAALGPVNDAWIRTWMHRGVFVETCMKEWKGGSNASKWRIISTASMLAKFCRYMQIDDGAFVETS